MYPQRRRGRGLAAGTLLTGLALVLAACGSSSDGSTASSGSSEGKSSLTELKADLDGFADTVTALPKVRPVADAASLTGKTIWWIPLGTQVDASFGPTINQAFGAVGIKVHTCDGKFLPTTVASCLTQAGDQKADAVVTGYVDYKSVPTAFDALASKGIPVLLAGAANNSGKKQSADFAFADTGDIAEQAARIQLESVITESDGKAHVLWAGIDDSAQLKAITGYAKSFVADNCPSCTWNQITTTSASLNKLASQAGATLTAKPDTDYVVAQIDPEVPALVQAIKASGKQGKVKVIGSGPLPDTLLMLQSGDSPLAAISGSSLRYEAWSFTGSALQMLTGKIPPEQISTLHRLFTPENSKDLSATPDAFATADWFANDADVVKSFTDAWGVS